MSSSIRRRDLRLRVSIINLHAREKRQGRHLFITLSGRESLKEVSICGVLIEETTSGDQSLNFSTPRVVIIDNKVLLPDSWSISGVKNLVKFSHPKGGVPPQKSIKARTPS